MAVRVLIIDAAPQRARELEAALAAAGFEVLTAVDGQADLYDRVQALAPEVILVDTELPGRDTLEHLASLNRRYPKPMIMLADAIDPAVTLAAARAGVTAYAGEAVSPASLRALVDLAIGHYRAHAALREELKKTRQNLESRKLVDRAKCRLMERRGLGEEAAYRRLQKMAMDRRMSITDLARELLGAEDLE